MNKILGVVLLIFSYINGVAQEKTLPAEAKAFLPEGYELLDYITGDINADKKKDAILVAKRPGEDGLTDQESLRPLIILTRDSNGKLKQAWRNDNAILCRHCGGSFGDPYEGIVVKPNGFDLSFYGGSSWRWGYTYSFSYVPSRKNWLLTKEKRVNFQSGDPETTMQVTNVPKTEFGEISIDKFNSAPVYDNSKWKVTAPKTYFFSSPLLSSKPGKAYLVKGNEVTGIKQYRNFVEVSFENGKGQITNGFILRKHLLLLNK